MSLGAVGLGGVLEQHQAVAAREPLERGHVGDLPVQVNGEDRRRARADRRSGGLRIEQAGGVLDVAEDRDGADVENR